GIAYLTATNEGATTVTQITVSLGDPLTTVEGFVTFEDGTPVDGAKVTIFGLTGVEGTTDSSGHYLLDGVATQVTPTFLIRADYTDGTTTYLGSIDDINPVPGGLTDGGIIQVFEGVGGGFGPLIPGVTHIEYPYPYRCPSGTTPEEQGMQCIDYLEQILFRKTVPPDEVAAIFVEPIQGEGGYIVPPEGFLKRLKALTEKHGILFVADEVQSGMGRTGKMFAIEHWGIEPDIICLAKGLASGMPLGAIVAKESVMNWPPGAHASTFGGNPVSCVAALETIALLQEELIDNTQQVGAELFQGLRELQKKHRLIGDVRGKGLMLCIELVGDRESKVPAVVERDELVLSCFHKGLLLLGCGENSIRFSPPLVVDSEQVKTALSILDESLTEIEETS
ncbi:MAG: aminotransferase class III-fold pyridoxal phosphate-dependent enzyme, partial [Planctomycetes bacterium]|nr:aminotransferase class III-fold pyridoxal phosphate-dependent enzyme [Planctomycetota bacterium]